MRLASRQLGFLTVCHIYNIWLFIYSVIIIIIIIIIIIMHRAVYLNKVLKKKKSRCRSHHDRRYLHRCSDLLGWLPEELNDVPLAFGTPILFSTALERLRRPINSLDNYHHAVIR